MDSNQVSGETTEATVKVQIVSRWDSCRVLFEADVPESIESGLRTRYALEKATQARANLADANLTCANLADANLTDANLTGANLTDAYLVGANLADAYLVGANLVGANLVGANLTGANLTDANLTGAYLVGAKWRGGIVINKQPLQISGLHWSVTILDAHMQIGCELHALRDWRDFDDARIVQMDWQALRFWRDHKAALLSIAESAGRSFEAPVVAEVA